jgi:hypothetical protein
MVNILDYHRSPGIPVFLTSIDLSQWELEVNETARVVLCSMTFNVGLHYWTRLSIWGWNILGADAVSCCSWTPFGHAGGEKFDLPSEEGSTGLTQNLIWFLQYFLRAYFQTFLNFVFSPSSFSTLQGSLIIIIIIIIIIIVNYCCGICHMVIFIALSLILCVLVGTI